MSNSVVGNVQISIIMPKLTLLHRKKVKWRWVLHLYFQIYLFLLMIRRLLSLICQLDILLIKRLKTVYLGNSFFVNNDPDLIYGSPSSKIGYPTDRLTIVVFLSLTEKDRFGNINVELNAILLFSDATKLILA